MNENEMNQQNVTMSNPLGSNVSVKPIDTLMDDFEDAVIKQPDPVVVPVKAEPVTLVEEPMITEPVSSVEPETVVPKQEVESQETLKNNKKNGNWIFIFSLFAIVGLFVILLPLLVRWFGY